MTQDQIDQIKKNLTITMEQVKPLISLLSPQAAVAVVIGSAVLSVAPDVYQAFSDLIHGKEPTDEDAKIIAEMIAKLQNPETL